MAVSSKRERPSSKTQAKSRKAGPSKRKATDDVSPRLLKKQRAPNEVKARKPKMLKKPIKPQADESLAQTTQSSSNTVKKIQPGHTPVVSRKRSAQEDTQFKGLDKAQLDSFLVGFDTSDDGESSNEATAGSSTFRPGQTVGKIPKLHKPRNPAGANGQHAGVLYIGRIPHGFYEHEMREYFSQFGPITRLRLSRNKKTGKSKHYAFIEFAEASTAEIVVKTMNNYLLFGHLLKCRLMPPEQVHPDLWLGANRRFKIVPHIKLAALKLAQPRTEAEWVGAVTREQRRRLLRAAKLKDQMGFEYSEPDLKQPVGQVPVPSAAPEATHSESQEQSNTTEGSQLLLASSSGESQTVVGDIKRKRSRTG